MFEFMIHTGKNILMSMTAFLDFLMQPINTLLPSGVDSLLASVPVLAEFLSFSLLEVICGVGLPLVIGYTLVKWLIP